MIRTSTPISEWGTDSDHDARSVMLTKNPLSSTPLPRSPLSIDMIEEGDIVTIGYWADNRLCTYKAVFTEADDAPGDGPWYYVNRDSLEKFETRNTIVAIERYHATPTDS